MAPKRRLKAIQRWILHEILDQIPAHDAAHGWARLRERFERVDREPAAR